MDGTVKKKIDSYLISGDKRPLIVDVSSLEMKEELSHSYCLLHKQDVLELAKNGCEIPSIGDIYEFMETCKESSCLIYNLGSLLRLLGAEEIALVIHALLGNTYRTRFIIVTYQCFKYFNEKIPKYKDNIICIKSENITKPSSLVFIPTKFKKMSNSESALKFALAKIERTCGEKIYVTTSYSKADFAKTLIGIDECESPYDLICVKDNEARKLNKKFGTTNEWEKLLEHLQENSVEKTIEGYITIKDISSEIKDWNEKDSFRQWLLFIYLKLKNVHTDNWAIDYAIENSQNTDEFLFSIYESILNIDYNNPDFWKKYCDRKKILIDIHDDFVVYSYCNLVPSKEENAIYYLTDNNDVEKKKIIEIIDKYRDKFTKQKLMLILQYVYKDLYDYLTDYNYGDEFLSKYFNEYKYLKVINYLTPEFKNIVDKEAMERSFKRRLVYRSEKLDDIIFNYAKVYFIDALGVEFLSFIERKCQEKNLACKTTICKSYLPSLTSKNTEFRDYFAKKGINVVDEKRLDSLIHDGKDDYDFDKNKLPIHIVEEFKIINECLDNIRKNIKNQSINKAVIISDHGATRLAILNTDMIKEEVESVGEHGGRVCKEIPGMPNIPNAIIENGYCVLADYNVIKGGRVGKVEMHGGATLEEVTVPIIEISDLANYVKIKVLDEVIRVSFKKKAILRFYSSKKMTNVMVKVNGKSYLAFTEDQLNFTVELSDIKKSGIYKFEVWENTEIKSAGNEFKIEKESARTNDLWGENSD